MGRRFASLAAPLAVLIAAVGVGVAAGVGIGASLLGVEDEAEMVELRRRLDVADRHVRELEERIGLLEGPKGMDNPTPTPTPEPLHLPPEDADWDPCENPGLCDFVAALDDALAREDVEAIMGWVDWQPVDCSGQDVEDLALVSLECKYWPEGQSIPTMWWSGGFAVGRGPPWRLPQDLSLTDAQVPTRLETHQVAKSPRAIILPARQDRPWDGNIAVLVGAAFDQLARLRVNPEVSPEALRGALVFVLLRLRVDDAGVWRIRTFVRASEQYLAAFSGEIVKFRYYPLTATDVR